MPSPRGSFSALKFMEFFEQTRSNTNKIEVAESLPLELTELENVIKEIQSLLLASAERTLTSVLKAFNLEQLP